LNRPLLEKTLYWADSVRDLSSTRQYIEDRVFSQEPGARWYKVVQAGELCGVFGLKSIDAEKRSAQVGYWLSAASHGEGLISKAIAAIASELRLGGLVEYLEFHCLEDNHASMAVARRAGGEHVETIENYLELDGRRQHLMIFRAEL